jgi:hypothetical protein
MAGTFELAEALSTARKKFRSDNDFRRWLNGAGLASITPNDRAALILIGRYPKEAREYFNTRESWSWRMCEQGIRAILRTYGTSVSQPAKPVSVRVTSYVEQTSYQLRLAPELPPPVEEKGYQLRLVPELPPPEAPPPGAPLPELIDLSNARMVEAARTLKAMIEILSLSPRNVARHVAPMGISSDQTREITRWSELLTDDLEEIERPGDVDQYATGR